LAGGVETGVEDGHSGRNKGLLRHLAFGIRGGQVMPFAIDAREVHRLDPLACTDFVNHLLRAEARRAGVPQHHVCTTLQTNTSDEKVDAALTDPACRGTEWLPPGESIRQCKSGRLSPGDVEGEVCTDRFMA
jgi:hypothetical protein